MLAGNSSPLRFVPPPWCQPWLLPHFLQCLNLRPCMPWSISKLCRLTKKIHAPPMPTTTRFTTVCYTDASFAVGELKDSFSGLVIYVNGTPILWGSMCQTTPPDSTSSAEFVAASVCCKQVQHVENMFHFLGFLCPKPYPMYSDSQASMAIAMNSQRMGKIRHIAIRYHLVRVMAANGDVKINFCVTEDMVADLFTKILSGATFDHLAARFYFIGL
jgi:hypothetical protein